MYYITHTQVLPHPSFQEGRAEYKCKKETRDKGVEGRGDTSAGGERREMVEGEEEGEGEEGWKKKQRSSTNYNYVA